MPQRFEGQLRGYDQSELFFQTWTPERARGVLLLTHGMAEHSECYHTLAKQLSDDGWIVYSWDLRGHGRSEGKRGYVKNISEYVDDLECMHRMASQKHPDLNLVMFGHSMGGLVTLRFLQTRRVQYSCLVLSSPALGLSVKVPVFKEKLAQIAVRWLPTITLHNEIKYEDLTRSEEMLNSYKRDTLRHDKISPGLFLSMVELFGAVKAQGEEIRQPVLALLSGEDRIVSTDATREFFDTLPNKKSQLIVYPESLHEILNDLDRDKVVADLKKFINPYLGA
jgi:alpha-beta hydrolase superfamily lysophospholipase